MLQKINIRLVASVLFVGTVLAVAPVSASDWMFRRSYHSHENGRVPPSGEVPWSRSAYREPFVGGNARGVVRSGWRINNYQLQNGNAYDRTYIREGWFDVNY